MSDNTLYQGRYRIPAARLANYDYGSNGMYFITICTQNRQRFFGTIAADTATLQPTVLGQVAMDCWYRIPEYFPFVALDAFQVMPDHLHGIICINKAPEEQTDWQPNRFGPQRQNLASILRGYKSGVKSYATRHQLEFGWQPRYYDRVIRDENELNRIRTYIEINPLKWVQKRLDT